MWQVTKWKMKLGNAITIIYKIIFIRFMLRSVRQQFLHTLQRNGIIVVVKWTEKQIWQLDQWLKRSDLIDANPVFKLADRLTRMVVVRYGVPFPKAINQELEVPCLTVNMAVITQSPPIIHHYLILSISTVMPVAYFRSLVASDQRWPIQQACSMMFEMLQGCWLANAGR